MAANPNDPRTKRRQAAGDDPNKMSVAPQPIPGMPQDQKAGNVMNNPMFDVDGQMSQRIGGPASMTYGDMSLPPDDGRLGNVGFAEPSGQPENIVPGRGMNMQFAYNTQPQPDPEQQKMMEPMYDMAQAQGLTMPGGPQSLNNGLPPSYDVTALGPTGMSAPTPGQVPPELSYSGMNNLPLQGVQSAEFPPAGKSGMSTGRGGGRNRKA